MVLTLVEARRGSAACQRPEHARRCKTIIISSAILPPTKKSTLWQEHYLPLLFSLLNFLYSHHQIHGGSALSRRRVYLILMPLMPPAPKPTIRSHSNVGGFKTRPAPIFYPTTTKQPLYSYSPSTKDYFCCVPLACAYIKVLLLSCFNFVKQNKMYVNNLVTPNIVAELIALKKMCSRLGCLIQSSQSLNKVVCPATCDLW